MEDLVLKEVSPGVVEVRVGQVSIDCDDETVQNLCFQGDGLTDIQQEKMKAMLQNWGHLFAKHDEDFGCTGEVQHNIPTGTAAPIRERYRPIPPTMYQEVRSLLGDMLKAGVIKESSSPWAAPIVLVRKKNGELRFCVDYRKLNAVTHKDAHPLPRIEEALTTLSKAEYYSTLDLASGYWQVEVAPQDREKTAFCTPFELYEFERMPFGLCNAPATFQRLMQRCLGGLVSESALVYLDDVIVFSADFDSHLKDLEKVFTRLGNFGLKLRPDKCTLFQKQVKFLGHVVSGEGVAPDPEKISCVQNWTTPHTVSQVRSFLGFAGYYRRFIAGFSKVAQPLNALLVGIPKGEKKAPVAWSTECEESFKALKEALVQAPILAFADFTLPFRVYTDASLTGLGAVLAQIQEGKERVIAYASRSLHPAERNDANYNSFKLELLALKWAITDKFKDFLWGAQFTVFTDNNPLVHLQSAKLGAVEQRWAAQLANYQFDVKYRPGNENANADVLSRFPPQVQSPHSPNETAEVEACLIHAVWGPDHWQPLQEGDPTIKRLRYCVGRGQLPTKKERNNETATVTRLLGQN